MSEGLGLPIKGVHTVHSKGRFYYYVCRGGARFWTSDTRLKEPFSREFIEAYHAARNVDRLLSGTFSDLLIKYKTQSAQYKRLSREKSKAYTSCLHKWEDMITGDGKTPLGRVKIEILDQPKFIRRLTTYRGKVWAHSASQQETATTALSGFIRWCLSQGYLSTNITENMEKPYKRQPKARIWTDGELAIMRANAPEHVLVVLEMALLTGQRMSDVLKIPVTAIGRDNILIQTGKSRGTKTALIPMIPELQDVLDRARALRVQSNVEPTTVLVSSKGKPWTSDGFKTSFYRVRDKVLTGEDRPNFHGLRKTAATRMVILHKKYPDIITRQILVDMFTWSAGELERMLRIYVDDDKVIEIMRSERKQNL